MELEVEGRHALLFDDDASAAFVNSREALVPWNDDASLLIDRYDVRHLLDRIPPRPPLAARKHRLAQIDGHGGVSLSELDLERYLDLPADGDDDGGSSASETIGKSGEIGSGVYQAVPFSYGNTGSSADPNTSDSGQSTSGFHPPFPVPEGLLSNLIVFNTSPVGTAIIVQDAWSRDEVTKVAFHGHHVVMCLDVRIGQPPTEKLHQIIARTAEFVASHGGQSEIVLRVKQGDNPTFGFLMPDNHLHAYFRFLVDHPHLLRTDTAPSETQEEKKSDDGGNEAVSGAGGALSLLGSVYGSGEDDDSALPSDSKEVKPGNVAVAVKTDANSSLHSAGNVAPFSDKSEKGESSAPMALENKEVIKRPVVASIKEKSMSSQKNSSVNAAASATAAFNKKADCNPSINCSGDGPQNSQPSTSDVKLFILEPPSFLKRTIDKIVEFILRNGREFEAVLIEQDKTTGRFPFLLPSNQYHSYYLKILDETREAKRLGKRPSDQKHDEQFGSKRKSQEPPIKEITDYQLNSSDQSEGWSYNPQRKEKFKMVLSGLKKDSHEQRPKPAQQTGVTADEAAAIVLAATRGRSPANAFQNMLIGDSETGRACSIGSLSSSQGHKPISDPLDSRAKEWQKTTNDVSVATAIAKTVALAATREADSSEAGLTKEQKLKAERLKRAKMFAAMIKRGSHNISELVPSVSAANGSLEPSTAGSTCSASGSDPVAKEREGSSVPFDSEASRGQKLKKNYRSRFKDEEEDSEDHKRSRKKHRSDEDKPRKSHSSARKDKESRHHHHHHHKHYSDSEDELRHRKSSRHRHRHKNHGVSEDEDQDRLDKHRRKHHSHSDKKPDIEGEYGVKAEDHSEERTTHAHEVGRTAVSDVQPSDATEVPNELRAKIRAMLLENM